ncbi:MAG: hypothetical protein ACOH5I_24310 [Oligoflexus sp.]
MKASLLWTLTSGFLVLSACGKPVNRRSSMFEAWIDSGSPARLFGEGFEDRFEALPTSGTVQQMPWADTYWPNYKRGLAWRWQAGDEVAQMPSKDDVQAFDSEQINRLSPAEKYDLYLGQYDYPLTSSELSRTDADQDSWWGLCHGYAPASILFAEPEPISVANPDGIEINFTSSDIKALLTYAQQYQRKSDSTLFMATRCNEDLEDTFEPYSRACRGVNPGSLHIALSEMLGNRQEAVVVDIEQGQEVWNFPAISYQSEILEESSQIYDSAAEGTVKIIAVNTTVVFVQPINPHTEAIGAVDVGQFITKDYQYTVELDKEGRIIGGDWKSDDSPDFLWLQTPFEFSGYFEQLRNLHSQPLEENMTSRFR